MNKHEDVWAEDVITGEGQADISYKNWTAFCRVLTLSMFFYMVEQPGVKYDPGGSYQLLPAHLRYEPPAVTAN